MTRSEWIDAFANALSRSRAPLGPDDALALGAEVYEYASAEDPTDVAATELAMLPPTAD